MVEILTVKVVNAHADAEGTHIRIPFLVLEKCRSGRLELVTIILADNALAGRAFIRLADASQQQRLSVTEYVRREQNDIRRLLVFFAGTHVGINYACNLLARLVVNEFRHKDAGAQTEFRLAPPHRHDRRVGRSLGIRLATDAVAIAAILTFAESNSFGVSIRRARDRNRSRKWMVAKTFCRLGEHQAGCRRLYRLVRIIVAARPLERVATLDDLALDVPGLAGGSTHLIELVVVRLELLVAHRPILDCHVLWDRFGAVSFADVAL